MIDDRFYLDPTCKLYLPFGLLDGASFASRDQFGHVMTNNDAVRSINGMEFDGISAFMKTSTPVLDFTTEDFTILMLLKIGAQGDYEQLINRGRSATDGYYCYRTDTDEILFRTAQAGVNQDTISKILGLATGEEYLFGAVRKGSEVKLYINGVDVTDVAGNHLNPTSTTVDFRIGIHSDESSFPFTGRIRMVACYGEAKPGIWMQTMYEEAR